MTWKLAAITTAVMIALPGSAQMAEQTASDIELKPAAPSPAAPPGDPISLDRVRKKLAELPPSAEQDRLKLEYYIEVYGRAPHIDLFQNFDVTAGPVPRSPPTHQDILDVVTPEGFRTPAPNLSAFIEWLRQKAAK
jgi:hypothetical protein